MRVGIAIGVVLVAITLTMGCAGTGSPYPLPTPQGYDKREFREVGYAEGYAVGRFAPLYTAFGLTDTVQRATEEAIAKNGGDAITDVIVTERYSYNPIFTSHGILVRGLVLKRLTADEREEQR